MSTISDPNSVANKERVDEISRNVGYGARNTSMFNTVYGINNINPGVSRAPANRDSTGYTFFTKPLLNLTYDNISTIRKLEFLGDYNPRSMACAIRCMLSPFVEHPSMPRDNTPANANNRALMVDDRNPFIPLLSNNLMDLSGWPDTSLDLYTSSEGIAKEVYKMVDGRPTYYGGYTLTGDFRNLRGDPITSLFTAWVEYQGWVSEGSIVPYTVMMAENEVDYMTRIYRLVMDESNTYVQKIAACGAAFPSAIPNAAAFNVNRSQNFSDANAQVSVPLECVGMIVNDPILYSTFNETVTMFNPDMDDSVRDERMVAMEGENVVYRRLLSNRCYPYIHDDYRLVWYAPIELFRRVIGADDGSETEGPQTVQTGNQRFTGE